MADTPSLVEAASVVAAAELAAAQAILGKATAFRAALLDITAGLTFPAGYVSQPKMIAQGLLASMTYQVDTQLPQIIKSYTPADPAAGAQPNA